jgi:hypothetical protein
LEVFEEDFGLLASGVTQQAREKKPEAVRVHYQSKVLKLVLTP